MKVPRAKWFRVGSSGEPYPARLRELDGKSGVYLIRVNGGPCAYVGESHTGNLRKTLTRHFQEWKRSGKKAFWEKHYGQQHDPGTVYDRGRCEVAVFLTSAERAPDLEVECIRRYRPTDNLADVPF